MNLDEQHFFERIVPGAFVSVLSTMSSAPFNNKDTARPESVTSVYILTCQVHVYFAKRMQSACPFTLLCHQKCF